MSQESTLDTLVHQPTPSRRARPPSMALIDEAPIPLRPEQLGRRESRIGIRSLFGRKGQKEPESPDQRTSRSPLRSTGIRASIADISNWHYGQQPVSLDVLKDPIAFFSKPLSATVEHPTSEEVQARAQLKARNGKQLGKPPPNGSHVVPWDAPPLFKAYPQAIKYSTLPSSILSPEALFRIRAKRLADATGDQSLLPELDAPNNEIDPEKPRRKRGWSGAGPEIMSEWTTKIYVLVTSGCLLQYASEGSFDRLPEKVLQLGKASAAFASDAIPGRHWVLQVSSALEPDGTTASDQRSLLSRLPFLVADRRQASNFLMVFESAEDMDGWLAILRREIENLGGKKALSETGRPKSVVLNAGLRERTSQRTLVIRDPDRYSKTFSVDASWRDGSEAGDYETLTETSTREQSLDGTSATNSVVSQDGRQLDSLRDSSHRLSAVSSGQRTVVTSEGSSSSPSSPTRDSFPSPEEEKEFALPPTCAETRIRPNASAIADRRRSLQNFGPIVDGRGQIQGAARQSSAMVSPPIPETVVPPLSAATPITPNFSVPHSSTRRFSYVKPHLEHVPPLAPPPRSAARKASHSTETVRPSSMLMDQAAAHGDAIERPAARHGDGSPRKPFILEPVPSSRRGSFTLPNSSARPLAKRSSMIPQEASRTFSVKPQPRRLASTGTLRTHEEVALLNRRDSLGQRLPTIPDSCPPLPTSLPSLGDHGNMLAPSPSHQVTRRTSMSSVLADRRSRKDRAIEIPPPLVVESLPQPAPPPCMPLPPLPPTAPSKNLQPSRASLLLSRRSLPHLVDGHGPPPAPPPTCALPPIPPRPSVKA